MERKLVNTNRIHIVGTLTDVDLKTAATKDGREYISGNIIVKSNEKDYKIRLFTMKMTKKNEVSKIYNNFLTLSDAINKRVSVDGSIDEAKIPENNTIKRGNQLSGQFVNILPLNSEEKDVAEFEIVGFIKQALTAIYEPDGATIKDYSLVIANPNYNCSLAKYIRLNVDKTNQGAINTLINSFAVKDTASFHGNLDFVVETETKIEKSDFGTDTVKTLQRNSRRYVIDGGKKLIGDVAYTPAEIEELLVATEQDDNVRLANSNSNTPNSANLGFVGTKSSVQPKLI